MARHVYDWARARGYWLRAGQEGQASHLLLDGGRLAVPPEAHAALLNAYAISIAAYPAHPPCMVEVRTPVFRMFLDLDARFDSAAAAAEAMALRGSAVDALLRRAATAAVPGVAALVCAASAPKVEAARDPGGQATHKLGFHVVWPDALVTTRTALALRERALQAIGDLCPADLGLVGRWEDILDSVVYRSSGLRMPWSAKGHGDSRVYVPRARLLEDGTLAALDPPRGVSAVRDLVHQLCIRSFGREATVSSGGGDDDDPDPENAESQQGQAYTHKALAAYSDALPALAAALPVQFLGQRFCGLLAAEHCFLLRSSARYCFNLGRQHRTNNVYFVLTRRGICQRCYCRCETTEGRLYGMCKDFSSEVWPVPPEVMEAFFGCGDCEESAEESHKSTPPSHTTAPGTMPSRSAASTLDFDALVRRSRPPKPKRAHKKKGT